MKPTDFPESNIVFGPPAGMDESQVFSTPAFAGKIHGGNLDGSSVSVVAWQPSPEEIEQIKNGAPIFLTVLGCLPPHFLSLSFKEARGL